MRILIQLFCEPTLFFAKILNNDMGNPAQVVVSYPQVLNLRVANTP